MSVTCENTLGSLETLAVSPVIVQNPVVDIHLTCTKKSLLQASKGFKENVACDLWLNSGTPEPTDAELEASALLTSVTIILFLKQLLLYYKTCLLLSML